MQNGEARLLVSAGPAHTKDFQAVPTKFKVIFVTWHCLFACICFCLFACLFVDRFCAVSVLFFFQENESEIFPKGWGVLTSRFHSDPEHPWHRSGRFMALCVLLCLPLLTSGLQQRKLGWSPDLAVNLKSKNIKNETECYFAPMSLHNSIYPSIR